MNVEIGAKAAQFPEKEYINGIAVAVWPILVLTLPVLLYIPDNKMPPELPNPPLSTSLVNEQ
jgi:hypothetical protein